VVEIATAAFQNANLVAVVVPQFVFRISDMAFQNNAITSLTLGDSVETIGYAAFQNNAISSLTLGANVQTIAPSAFRTNSLTELVIPASVTKIYGGAFKQNNLTSVLFMGNAPAIPGTVLSGNEAFAQNPSLTSVVRSQFATGWGSTWANMPVVIRGAGAIATVKPSMSGTAAVGKTLTAAAGTWTGYPAPTFTYQWYTCTKAVTVARSTVPSTCKAISNARSRTFKITSAHRNKLLAVFVTGTSLGTAPTSWLSTTSVDFRATATVKPSIKGTARVGSTLSASKGTWKGYPAPTFTYQWYACIKVIPAARSTMLATCTAIPDATSSTFRLTAAQRGIYVAVLVTGQGLRTTATTWLTKTTVEVK
jgi:hypothetical protein